jgi:hypothetical protein
MRSVTNITVSDVLVYLLGTSKTIHSWQVTLQSFPGVEPIPGAPHTILKRVHVSWYPRFPQSLPDFPIVSLSIFTFCY